MRQNGLGTITRVDFTPIHKKPGFVEDHKCAAMSAFVHFTDPGICADGKYYWMTGETLGQFWTTIANGEAYELQVSKNEYWICLPNKNPVQRTLMNIHQVVENGRHLENLITTQAAEIKNLTETVDNLSKKLEGVHDVIYQLVGGLYCQRTQSRMIDMHFYHLGFEEYKNVTNKYDTHPSGIWPTTRQGDRKSVV